MGHFTHILLFICVCLVSNGTAQLRGGQQDRQWGTFLGYFETLQHDVAGEVWGLDEEWIHVRGFTYDGRGPDAFFWVGTEGDQPSPKGHIVPFPSGANGEREMILPGFRGEDVLFRLPSELGIKVSDLKWISIWCRRFTVNFGSLKVPPGVILPKKRKISEMARLAHNVRSGNVTLLDAKTLYIPNLHYDGTAPDAFFWVGKGKPDRTGFKIPNEKKSLEVLGHYDGVDIELVLPDNVTLYDIDYLSIWCVQYRHNFGHVMIPQANDLYLPPALGQTQVKSGSALQPINTSDKDRYNVERSFPNCLELTPEFTVEWEAKTDSIEIRLTAQIDENQYMAFGLSPRKGQPVMENSDVVVAYYDAGDGSYHAVDYAITSRSPCDGTFGVCPDERIKFRNDASVITGSRHDGYTSVTYSRPYETGDRHDLPIPQGPVTIVGAIGSLNVMKEAKYHTQFVTKESIQVDLRNGFTNNCKSRAPIAAPAPRFEPWPANTVHGVSNFTVTIGPTGGDRGYSAITSTPSWGIAWWVNDMLIPEIYVERGQTYYFKVEGGNNIANQAAYHPFYITDSKEGGFSQKTKAEQDREQVFAGVEFTKLGMPNPTAVGRLCKWKHSGSRDEWQTSNTFAEYKQSLYKECDEGRPGSLVWTVPMDAPDLVYYQCYTHRHLGWKIHVNDPGFNQPSERLSGSEATRHSAISVLLSALVTLGIRTAFLR